MCVIAIKPKGVALPSKDLLKKMWSDNPDGAGFSVTPKDSTETFVEKGFLTFKHFYKYLVRYTTSIDDLVVMHFRWATHGYRSAGHTHPFPVSKYKSALERLKYSSDVVIFHNGIILMKNQPPTWSDTMYYIGGVIAHMEKLDYQKIIEHTTGNRLCIIDQGVPHITGEGWAEEEGIFYSNLSWKASKRKMITYASTSAFQEMNDAEWDLYMRSIEKGSKKLTLVDTIPAPYEN